MLLDEVRSSIDYYRNQPGSARLLRVVVTGGAAQLPGLPERLSALVGRPGRARVPARATRASATSGSPRASYPRLDPYLPAAVGLALGGAGVGTVIDLVPRNRKRSKADSRAGGPSMLKPVLAVAAGLIVVLGVPTFLANRASRTRRARRRRSKRTTRSCRPSIDVEGRSSRPPAAEVDSLDAQVTTLLEERRLVEPR